MHLSTPYQTATVANNNQRESSVIFRAGTLQRPSGPPLWSCAWKIGSEHVAIQPSPIFSWWREAEWATRSGSSRPNGSAAGPRARRGSGKAAIKAQRSGQRVPVQFCVPLGLADGLSESCRRTASDRRLCQQERGEIAPEVCTVRARRLAVSK